MVRATASLRWFLSQHKCSVLQSSLDESKHERHQKSTGDIMNILLATDGSSYTKRMLAYVAAHEEWLGARHRYVVVTAIPSIPPRAAAFLDREMVKGYYRDEAERVFKPIRTFFKQKGIEAEFASKAGPAAEVITKEAGSASFDLLMMGSHGHGSVVNAVMGSVATKVLASCTLPVLLVR
jgi:nucleotide-binding universal stress UspA family protein